MTTIFIFNAISSLLAAAGVTGMFVWRRRMARRDGQTEVVYVTDDRR
jgi:hypothetical protein